MPTIRPREFAIGQYYGVNREESAFSLSEERRVGGRSIGVLSEDGRVVRGEDVPYKRRFCYRGTGLSPASNSRSQFPSGINCTRTVLVSPDLTDTEVPNPS